MTAAERRAANRRRVAAGFGDVDPSPALTGAEQRFLATFRDLGGRARSEFAGGWKSTRNRSLKMGAGR